MQISFKSKKLRVSSLLKMRSAYLKLIQNSKNLRKLMGKNSIE